MNFPKKQRGLDIGYNLKSCFSLLVFNRFLQPTSKKGAFDNRETFFETFDFTLDDLYRSLDYFCMYSRERQTHLHQKVCEMIGRSSQLAYYDVTNYYFEIPYEDEDIYDEEGNPVKKVSRKRGPSKKHRKPPIIQMGLLMDTNGIPMAFNLFSGKESEKTSFLPAIRKAKRDFSLERVIVVADRGLNTSDNTAYLITEEQDLDKNGVPIKFKHKSRVFVKKIQLKDKNGNRNKTMEIYQKQMVYYSEKYAKKQRKDRERIIKKAEDIIADPKKYTKATSYGAVGYVKNITFVKETGEITDRLSLFLDKEKIQKEALYDGYYSIVTSEKKLSDKEMRDIYKGLWEIEESFRIIKSEFRARPVYVRTDNHVEAHFLICFVTLLILRVLEHLIKEKHTVIEIRNSLIRYSYSYLEQNYYLFDYRDEVIKTMESFFYLDLAVGAAGCWSAV